MRKIPFDENFFNTDNENSFYWAGILAADGSLGDRIVTFKCGSTTHVKSIKLDLIDKDMILSFCNDIKCFGRKIGERHYTTQKGKSCLYTIELKSHYMYNDLLRFGLIPNKSKILEMPNWLLNHPLINHFIRGYFDGDGSIFVHNGQKYIEFRGTISFLNSINYIIKNNISKNTKAKVQLHSNCGSLKYVGNNLVTEVGYFLYKEANIFMERKFKKFRHNDI